MTLDMSEDIDAKAGSQSLENRTCPSTVDAASSRAPAVLPSAGRGVPLGIAMMPFWLLDRIPWSGIPAGSLCGIGGALILLVQRSRKR